MTLPGDGVEGADIASPGRSAEKPPEGRLQLKDANVVEESADGVDELLGVLGSVLVQTTQTLVQGHAGDCCAQTTK